MVRSLYKGGKHNEFKNFRPLHILPPAEKILEKVIFKQLSEHLILNNLLNEEQFAYQKGKSAEQILMNFTDLIYKKLEENQKVLVVFIDFSKAFDTLTKEIILQRLKSIGVEGAALRWFEDYLSNRNIIGKINEFIIEISG